MPTLYEGSLSWMCLRVPKQKPKMLQRVSTCGNPHCSDQGTRWDLPALVKRGKNDESAQDGENLTRGESSAAGWVFSHD